jgi:hypothetical protein
MLYLLEITVTKEDRDDVGLPTYLKIEGKSWIEILSKLPLGIARHIKKEAEDLRLKDDDIPF